MCLLVMVCVHPGCPVMFCYSSQQLAGCPAHTVSCAGATLLAPEASQVYPRQLLAVHAFPKVLVPASLAFAPVSAAVSMCPLHRAAALVVLFATRCASAQSRYLCPVRKPFHCMSCCRATDQTIRSAVCQFFAFVFVRGGRRHNVFFFFFKGWKGRWNCRCLTLPLCCHSLVTGYLTAWLYSPDQIISEAEAWLI
jgi:hypothetical protein